jgi:tRNA(Arg) A34 adenosine deaminase TadA
LASDFDAAWTILQPGARRSLQLAYDSLAAGGLACGAAITDASSEVFAAGRNRAYDPPGGTDALQGTPLAHAEMNTLAAVSTYRDLSTCTLWSSHEPCSMCTAAAIFTGVGTVRYVAPDPWAIAAGHSRSSPGLARGPVVAQPDRSSLVVGPADDERWVVAANVMFLLSIALQRGFSHPTIVRNAELEADTVMLVRHLLDTERSPRPLTAANAFLARWWNAICSAAERRKATRLGDPPS